MKVRVRHDIGDLANDLASSAVRARSELTKVVRDGVRVGNMLARDFARESAGSHGKLYPKAFSTEMGRWRGGFGVACTSAAGSRRSWSATWTLAASSRRRGGRSNRR